MGLLIAIDDVGKGRGELQKIVEFQPEFIKLDAYFSRDLINSKRKQSFIKYLNFYSEQFDCHFILEGLETSEEVAFAKFLGVQLAQGFALGKLEQLENLISE